ncbi:MAG: type II toxin-antitoxin system ParD family antitoxin [Cyanothece sp. SIO2G6]|nr:type II toxin-antitoxin system ParD family antitoxin [Cyanothece sp. SIO2G6]
MNISIALPPNLQSYLETQIATGASTSVSEYILKLIEEDYQRQQAQDQFNALLQEGIESPSQPVTPDYWQDLRQSVVDNA